MELNFIMSNEETKSNNNNEILSPTNNRTNYKTHNKMKHVRFNNIIQYVDIEKIQMKTESTLENNPKLQGEKCLSFCCIII